jgi:hypothetical protein
MPMPAPLAAAGPILFTLGMLTLLGLMVAARRVPVWSPLVFGAGIVLVTVNLDLLPLAALLLVGALAPLARRRAPNEPNRRERDGQPAAGERNRRPARRAQDAQPAGRERVPAMGVTPVTMRSRALH